MTRPRPSWIAVLGIAAIGCGFVAVGIVGKAEAGPLSSELAISSMVVAVLLIITGLAIRQAFYVGRGITVAIACGCVAGSFSGLAICAGRLSIDGTALQILPTILILYPDLNELSNPSRLAPRYRRQLSAI